MARPKLPLAISRRENGTYSVELAGVPLDKHLSADGLTIEFSTVAEMPSQPMVTMRFCPGDLDIDLTAELLSYLHGLDEQ